MDKSGRDVGHENVLRLAALFKPYSSATVASQRLGEHLLTQQSAVVPHGRHFDVDCTFSASGSQNPRLSSSTLQRPSILYEADELYPQPR